MDLKLEGKTAVVTGGSRGIGKAIARELALEGVDVAISARDQAALEATAAELASETGRRIVPIRADTRSDEDVKDMVRRAASDFGHLDILVNNAAKAGGQAPVPKLSEITQELLWEDVDTKVMGYLRCAREAAPYMIERGWGRIINISSIVALTGNAGQANYSAAKAGLIGLTKSLAAETAKRGITINAIAPGMIDTPMTQALTQQQQAALREQIPTGNLGLPEDID